MDSNICPVCGWNALTELPYDEYGVGSDEICPSCGFQFGYSDDGFASGDYSGDWTREQITDDYRKKWTDGGMKWWSPNQPSPADWNPSDQLKSIGVDLM